MIQIVGLEDDVMVERCCRAGSGLVRERSGGAGGIVGRGGCWRQDQTGIALIDRRQPAVGQRTLIDHSLFWYLPPLPAWGSDVLAPIQRRDALTGMS